MEKFDIKYFESKIRCGINQTHALGYQISPSGWGVNWDYNTLRFRPAPNAVKLWPTAIFIFSAKKNIMDRQMAISSVIGVETKILDSFNTGFGRGNLSILGGNNLLAARFGYQLADEIFLHAPRR